MFSSGKPKTPAAQRRLIDRYERKLKGDLSPTQRQYAYSMKRRAEADLAKSLTAGHKNDKVVDLAKDEYTER